MISVIPQSIAAATQVLTVDLTEKLCAPYCVQGSIQPSVDVTYSVDETNLVGTVLYVTIKAQGTVTYVPKNGNACCPKTKVFTEYFTTSFAGATAASVASVAQANGIVRPSAVNCYNVAMAVSALNTVTITLA